MEAGILAAIVILSVELVIVIALIAYLFCRPRRTAHKGAIPETGDYNKKNPAKVADVTLTDEKNKESKEEPEKLKELEPERVPDISPEPITEKPNASAEDRVCVDEEQELVEKEPEPTSHSDIVYKESEPIANEDIVDKEPESALMATEEPEILSENLAKDKDPDTSSSSDEGVGDIQKAPLTSSDSSSSSDSEEEEKPNDENQTNKLKSEDSSSSSSSSSESEDEPIIVAEETKDEIQTYETAETLTAPVAIDDTHNSIQHSLGSLESGITLSLRLDKPVEPKALTSSSPSSSSSEEEGIQVTRRRDVPPIKDSGGDIALIYDPLRHKVVNMDALRNQSSTSSSSDSESDEAFPAEADEVVAGIINVTSGEKLTICKAVSKGLIPEKTGMLLLEAQAATGSVVNPRTGVKLSVTDAVKQGVVDSRFKSSLSAAEGAYYGYLDPRKNESVPLFQAMKRGIFPRAQGMRLLEAQVATGGIVDPWSGMRYPLDGALKKGLVDQATAKVLKSPDDHADFFDPNTKQRFSYGDLLSKCIRDLNTGLKFLYIEEKPRTNTANYQPDLLTFRSAFRRKVSFQDLVSAGLVDRRTLDLFNRGHMSREELQEKMKPYLTGEQAIAGIYNRSTNEILTICQAVKSGLLRRSTALELLEAQAATGNIIDPKSGKQMSVSRAVSVGLVDKQFASALRRAELSVLGYNSGDNNRTISLFEAMNRGQVLEVNGIRLLDAQIATGGLIDPVGGYRIPVSVATSRGLIDQRLADALAHPSPDQKGFFDPNTEENLTYGELLRRSVVDKKKHIGMRLLPINDKSPNVRLVSKGPTRTRKIIIMNPNTHKPMSLKQAVAANVIDSATARHLQSQQGGWVEK